MFLQKRLYIFPSFLKKVPTLHRKYFPKDSLFTTFPLFLKVSEVRNISNKC